MKYAFAVVLLVLAMALSGCRGLGQTPPPTALNPDALATANALTANAPPPGYETRAFPTVDAGLSDIQGYRYTLEVRFEGVRDSDLVPITGLIRAEVWWDGIAPARRVVLRASGEAFAAEPQNLEAVRIVDAYYLVDENGRCLINADEAAQAIAALDAGSLIGGVEEVPYTGVGARLNGIEALRYDVTPEDVVIPSIVLGAGSTVALTGEVWLTPVYDVVVRYYANLDVSGVRLFEGEATVSGQLFIRYDVYDLGEVPNISIPYGC